MREDELETTLHELYRSLDERWRPEDVAQKVADVLDLNSDEMSVLKPALRSGGQFTMSRDFQRPKDMTCSLSIAETLFGRKIVFAPDDVARIEKWVSEVERTIGKAFGRSDFKSDRLSKPARKQAGITISRRQYNKRFRLVARLEEKVHKLAKEQFKRALTLASKNRLAAHITWEDFSADSTTACFIAYYVARCNLRSLFTNTSQTRPYDKICHVLMERCIRHKEATNWWAIAHVLPNEEVLVHLNDEQKGRLLADYFNLMSEAAGLLKELWETNSFTEDMVVRKGNDSTTWNVTAGAWNKVRDGWFSLLYSLGMLDAVEQVCPGKVLRLVAADVAYWHRSSGGDVHHDTPIWKELPRPWEVLAGEVTCPKSLVEKVCAKYKTDPIKSGWSAPKPGRVIERFSPTPELVHGVVVASPALALVLRKAGVFSGKQIKAEVSDSAVDGVRWRHRSEQEQRRERKQKIEELLTV